MGRKSWGPLETISDGMGSNPAEHILEHLSRKVFAQRRMSAICQALGNGRRCQQASSCTMLAQTSTGVIWAILKTFSHSLCRIILGTPKLTPFLRPWSFSLRGANWGPYAALRK